MVLTRAEISRPCHLFNEVLLEIRDGMIVTVTHQGQEWRYELTDEGQVRHIIGKSEAAGIRIPSDGALSREHLALERHGGRWLVRDLDSTNGTDVNGEPVTEAYLRDGDLLRAGHCEIAIQLPVSAGDRREAGVAAPQSMLASASGEAVVRRPRYLVEGRGGVAVGSGRQSGGWLVVVLVVLSLLVLMAGGLVFLRRVPADRTGIVREAAREAVEFGDVVVLHPGNIADQGRPVPHAFSGRDVNGIEALVQAIEEGSEPWRTEARKRIDNHRKADISVTLTDAAGHAVPGAEVHLKLMRHAFRFGGIVDARQMVSTRQKRPVRDGRTGADPVAGSSAALYRQAYLDFGFNHAGFCNALKYKLHKGYDPIRGDCLDWLKEHDIPVRGHCLMWPGGTAKTNHLCEEVSRLVDRYQKVGGDAAKRELKLACERVIREWAEKWDVTEWDVINETRGNHVVMDILGREVMIDWFKIARQHAVNPDAGLYLNENRVVSDDRETGVLTSNVRKFRDEVQFLVDRGAPISGLGLQSRFHNMVPGDILWQRLCVFNDFGLPIAATEFEMNPSAPPAGGRKGKHARESYEPMLTELDKAIMTERVMTAYFSHHLVNGIFVWTFMDSGKLENNGDPDERHLVGRDGRPNLRGKTWLYLTRNLWSTEVTLRTDSAGTAVVRGFKGKYAVRVRRDGAAWGGEMTVGDDRTWNLELSEGAGPVGSEAGGEAP